MAVDNKYLDDTIRTVRAHKNHVKMIRQVDGFSLEKLAILRNELDNFTREIDYIVYRMNHAKEDS